MTLQSEATVASRWVLQLCHGYEAPFLDCARQYAALFSGTPYKVCTVYLTGTPKPEVVTGSGSDDVVFLNYSSRDLRGLKLKAIQDTRRIVDSRPFAFCIAHRFKPIYVALLGSGIPVIGVQHAFGVYSRKSRRLFVRLFKERLTLLGVSNAVRDDIAKSLRNWPEARVKTLYNRIDVAATRQKQVSREEAREALGLPSTAWVIGNVGRLHPDKDQATLIRGFALAQPRLPGGSLLAIMGGGPLEPELRALAGQLGVTESVRFLGRISEGLRFFKAFDVFALTSDHEPFGMVLLEAMAAGVPIVCSDCGGGREVVRGVADLVPQGEVTELADSLVRQSRRPSEETVLLQARMRASLEQRFSDEAVRNVFWSLPTLSPYVS